MKNKEVILGLDCSTTSTGWCVFDDKGLAAYGVIKPEGEDWRDLEIPYILVYQLLNN